MHTIQRSTTAAGSPVTYGSDKGTTWLEIDHGRSGRTAVYATPGWTGGMERIRELIAAHGIKVLPEHKNLFSQLSLAA